MSEENLTRPLGDNWPEAPKGWTADDTEAFLKEQALPTDFTWPHRDRNPDGSERLMPVLPSYRLHKGYGFWLRTTPYFPGLFEEVHAVLVRWPEDQPLPDAQMLAALLTERRKAGGRQEILPNIP